MPAITVRPAQGNDFHPMQAMSNGESGASCYPSFVSASHRFFVACDGFNVVGFVCAYPGREANAGYVQLMEPYLYTRYRDQGIEDTLKAAVLEWAEQRLDLHFFKEDPFTLHPIKPHEYLQSLKYDVQEALNPPPPEPGASLEIPATQGFFAPVPA